MPTDANKTMDMKWVFLSNTFGGVGYYFTCENSLGTGGVTPPQFGQSINATIVNAVCFSGSVYQQQPVLGSGSFVYGTPVPLHVSWTVP